MVINSVWKLTYIWKVFCKFCFKFLCIFFISEYNFNFLFWVYYAFLPFIMPTPPYPTLHSVLPFSTPHLQSGSRNGHFFFKINAFTLFSGKSILYVYTIFLPEVFSDMSSMIIKTKVLGNGCSRHIVTDNKAPSSV